MFQRAQRACVDFAVLPLVLFSVWGGPSLGQTQATSSAHPADTGSPTVSPKLSFVFMGCNRVQAVDWDKTANPSSANLPQLKQSLKDISQLNPQPSFLFFMGDLVVNLERDKGKTLKDQLDAWTDVFNASPLAHKDMLIPLPGNHEMLMKGHAARAADMDDESIAEVPNPPTDSIWLKWLHDSQFDKGVKLAHEKHGKLGPKAPQDQVDDDQSELTYSFTKGDVCFIVINTDTYNTCPTHGKTHHTGWIPLDWITQEVGWAQKNSNISDIFLIGHKPIMKHPKGEEGDLSILNTTEHQLGNKLRELLEANDKVRAYLCAHEHLWHFSYLDKAKKVLQVIAGNAGSMLNSKWKPPFFGFSLINVYDKGKIELVSYQRPVPKPHYYDDNGVGPAKPHTVHTLYGGHAHPPARQPPDSQKTPRSQGRRQGR